MNARTFGRKGDIGAPAQRRAALVAHQPRSFQPIADAAPSEDPEARRAAFLTQERARRSFEVDAASPIPAAEIEEAAAVLRADPAVPPTDRSLKSAYLIWFFLGLAGGHRFYLRRPLTGALQALLLVGCAGAVGIFQYYQAFAGLGLSWLWYLADGIRLKRLYEQSGRP